MLHVLELEDKRHWTPTAEPTVTPWPSMQVLIQQTHGAVVYSKHDCTDIWRVAHENQWVILTCEPEHVFPAGSMLCFSAHTKPGPVRGSRDS